MKGVGGGGAGVMPSALVLKVGGSRPIFCCRVVVFDAVRCACAVFAILLTI